MMYVNQFFDPSRAFGKCAICRSPEHLKRYCPEGPWAGAPWPDCPICQLGHGKANCPLAGCCTLCFERAHNAQQCPHRPAPAPVGDRTGSAPTAAAVESAAEAPVGPAPQPMPYSRSKGLQCYNCSGFGHISANCPGKRETEPQAEASAASQQAPQTNKDGGGSRGPRCHHCGERGHMRADCPNMRGTEPSGANAVHNPQPHTSSEADKAERSATRAAQPRRDGSPAAAGEAELVDQQLHKWEKVSHALAKCDDGKSLRRAPECLRRRDC